MKGKFFFGLVLGKFLVYVFVNVFYIFGWFFLGIYYFECKILMLGLEWKGFIVLFSFLYYKFVYMCMVISI